MMNKRKNTILPCTLNKRRVPSLPEEFAVVKATFLPSKEYNTAVCSDATSKLMLLTTTDLMHHGLPTMQVVKKLQLISFQEF